MTFAELLTDVIGRLDRAGVPYMVTGSLASSYHGEPRATRDVDIVIDPTPESLDQLVASLVDGNYYVDADAAYEALARRAPVQCCRHRCLQDRLHHPKGPSFLDRGVPSSAASRLARHDRIRHDRRRPRDRKARMGDGFRLRSTAARRRRIVAVADGLDEGYIDRWAAALGLTDAWRQVRDGAR